MEQPWWRLGITLKRVNHTLYSGHLERLLDPDNQAWYTDFLMDIVLALVRHRRQAIPLSRQKDGFPEVRIPEPALLFWRGDDLHHSYGSLPVEGLGEDASWRSKITLSVINSKQGKHFVLLAVFGPKRLAVVYDGLGGTVESPKVTAVSDVGT